MIRLVLMSMAAGSLGLASGALAEPQTFKDCADCPEMVAIQAGAFRMGPAPGEEEREGVDKDFRLGASHRVAVPAFAIGKYEVTRTEYEAFVKATGHSDGECGNKNWRNPGFPQTERDPVVCVSWSDAMAYIGWLSRTTGKTYRLPSEAEWEYAARAGAQTTFYWGGSHNEACGYGNFADLTYAAAEKNVPASDIFPCTDGYARTSPVGRFKPNAFGLHDMLGNAWEWTADCFNRKYSGAPTDGRAWLTGGCTLRVQRGGSWYDAPWSARAATRIDQEAESRNINRGFRVARTN